MKLFQAAVPCIYNTTTCSYVSSACSLSPTWGSSDPYSIVNGCEFCRARCAGQSRWLCSDGDNCSLSITCKRHIYPRRDAFDTPVFITSERLARMQRGLPEQHRPDLCGGREERRGICQELDEEEPRCTDSSVVGPGGSQTESSGATALPSYRDEHNWERRGESRANAPLCSPREHKPRPCDSTSEACYISSLLLLVCTLEWTQTAYKQSAQRCSE